MKTKPTYEELENRIKKLELLLTSKTKTTIAERKHAEDFILERKELLKESQKIAKIGSWNLNLASKQLIWSDQTYY